MIAVAEPSLSPKQFTGTVVKLMLIAAGWLMFTLPLTVQPSASVSVTLFTPAHKAAAETVVSALSQR